MASTGARVGVRARARARASYRASYRARLPVGVHWVCCRAQTPQDEPLQDTDYQDADHECEQHDGEHESHEEAVADGLADSQNKKCWENHHCVCDDENSKYLKEACLSETAIRLQRARAKARLEWG